MSDVLSEQGTCGGCRYFEQALRQVEGKCRRHAPTWRLSGVRAGSAEKWDSESAWPSTNAHDWCGEYREQKLSWMTEKARKKDRP